MKKVAGYLPPNDGGKAAFKDADLIVIPAGIPRKFPDEPLRDLRMANCATQASRA